MAYLIITASQIITVAASHSISTMLFNHRLWPDCQDCFPDSIAHQSNTTLIVVPSPIPPLALQSQTSLGYPPTTTSSTQSLLFIWHFCALTPIAFPTPKTNISPSPWSSPCPTLHLVLMNSHPSSPNGHFFTLLPSLHSSFPTFAHLPSFPAKLQPDHPSHFFNGYYWPDHYQSVPTLLPHYSSLL